MLNGLEYDKSKKPPASTDFCQSCIHPSNKELVIFEKQRRTRENNLDGAGTSKLAVQRPVWV
jgi:hypothetical protein